MTVLLWVVMVIDDEWGSLGLVVCIGTHRCVVDDVAHGDHDDMVCEGRMVLCVYVACVVGAWEMR